MASRICWIQLEHWASRRQAGALAMSWKPQCTGNASPLPPACGSLPSSLGLLARADNLANHLIPPSKLLEDYEIQTLNIESKANELLLRVKLPDYDMSELRVF